MPKLLIFLPCNLRLENPSPLSPNTVRFNETDLQFATRLMEESGYFYFFEHAADQHTLVVTDYNSFQDIPGATLRFDSNITAEDVLTAWNRPTGTTHGKVTLKDYDPTQPSKPLQATDEGDQDGRSGATARDVFLWPAATHHTDVVNTRSKLMIQAAVASVAVVNGAGAFRPLVTGARFTLQQDPLTNEQNVVHVVRWMSFEAVDDRKSTRSCAGLPSTPTASNVSRPPSPGASLSRWIVRT